MANKKNGGNNNNNGGDKYDEVFFWKYWKRTVLEDLDELRNHIIDIRLEQARLAVEQQDLEIRIERLQKMLNQEWKDQWVIEVELEEGDTEDDR